MKFQPKTEAELSNVWPAGVYDFDIKEAGEALSKANNEMIVLVLTVYDSAGRTQVLKDYLLESIEYKLRHACDACGLLSKYEKGEIHADDFVGKSGKLKLGIAKGKKKPDSDEFYSDKNSVSDYIKRDPNKIVNEPIEGVKKKPDLDDDIPF